MINQVVRAAGFDPAQYYAADGCGLSLYNYVTADLLVHLLRLNYHNTAAYEALLPTLPSPDATARSASGFVARRPIAMCGPRRAR